MKATQKRNKNQNITIEDLKKLAKEVGVKAFRGSSSMTMNDHYNVLLSLKENYLWGIDHQSCSDIYNKALKN
ncbi:MAG: hypothetical protein HQK84_05950 [Nitrospinae bacterium]|nr:hypothetical protein [Nitrospinota bacterium]